MFSQALRKTGRPILLSLSPGPTPLDKAASVRQYANLWRISNDFWDHWRKWTEPERSWSQGLLDQFTTAAASAGKGSAGHYPDADMLPIGMLGPRPGLGKARKSELSPGEERTVVTLWCIMQSPLIMGGNLTELDPFTASLLTNDEVLAVDQHATNGRPVVNDSKRAIWIAHPDAGAGVYLAVFNLADSKQPITVPLQPLGIGGTSYRVRDLWEKKELGSTDVLKTDLEPHAAVLYRLQ